MKVPVVNVRVVRMLVRQDLVPMWVSVRLLTIPWEFMQMLMMFVVAMAVAVHQGLMRVHVLVPLANVKPDPQPHQGCGDPEHGAGYIGPDCQ